MPESSVLLYNMHYIDYGIQPMFIPAEIYLIKNMSTEMLSARLKLVPTETIQP